MLRYKSQINRSVNHVLRYQSFDTKRPSSSSFEVIRRSNLNLVLNLSSVLQSLFRLCGSFCLFWLRCVPSSSVSASKSVQAFVIRNKGPRVLETGLNQFDAQPLVKIFGRLNWHAAPSNADRRRAIYGRRSQRNSGRLQDCCKSFPQNSPIALVSHASSTSE